MSRKLLLILTFLALGFTISLVSAHEDAAHLRFGHFVADAPNVDIFVNDEIVLEDFAPAAVSDFLEFEPGDLTVAISPTGEGMHNVIVGPMDVTVAAEHNYSIGVIGQATDERLTPLVIDETAIMDGCDMSKNVLRILINNIDGVPALSFYENDMWVEKNIEYGSYSAACFRSFFWDTGKAVIGEDLDRILFDFDSEADGNGSFWEPYTVYFWGLMGHYPGTPDEDYYFGGGNWYTVAPDPVSFLSAFSGLKLTGDSQLFFEFDTMIEAIRTAGLEKMLAEDGPFTMFVPINQGFAALPEGEMDRLMADPEALKDVLLYHVVKGSYRYDDLIDAGTLTTLQGSDIIITPPEDDEDYHFYINGDTRVTNFEYPLPDGSIIWFIDNETVLMPPAR